MPEGVSMIKLNALSLKHLLAYKQIFTILNSNATVS